MVSIEQKKAIDIVNGPVLLVAGPGSGKTYVLTNRIKNLICNENISPSNILIITFTKAASVEMRDRFFKLCESENIKLYDTPTFGTFHSIFFEILREDFSYDKNSLISNEYEKEIIVNILSDYKNIVINDGIIKNIIKEIKDYKLSIEKNEKFIPKSFDKKTFFDIYNKYKKILLDSKKLDFSDMISVCKELLNKNPHVLKKYNDKYKYVLIDEFQDINNEQYDIVKMICSTKNIFVVGDDDQSIYKFRGSSPRVLRDFKKDYKKSRTIYLNTNYRSKSTIVNFSKRIIDCNVDRFKKDLVPNDKDKGHISIKVFDDSREENEYVVDIIKNAIRNGQKLNDIAILYRTNMLGMNICKVLNNANIDYKIRDMNNNPFDFFAISDIVSYLNIACGNLDSKYIIDIMNKPIRYIKREAIVGVKFSFDDICKFYIDKNYILKNVIRLKKDIDTIKNMPPALAIKYIRNQIGYEDYIVKYCLNSDINYEEVKSYLDEFEDVSVYFKTIEELLMYVKNYKTLDDNFNTDCVKLMTFHSSKGLEFKTVIIIDANDGLIPHKKSIKSKDIEAERRLFYVAITRAKENLHILFTKNRNGKQCLPSRFLIEGIKGEVLK